MTALPLHPSAEAVIGASPAWTVAELAAAVARSGGTAAALAVGLGWVADRWPTPVPAVALRSTAQLEAELYGDIRIRPEYLLLGILRALGAEEALRQAREDYQRLLADAALDGYLRLAPLPRLPGRPRPRAVVVAGLPGTGKSTLAEALARQLRAPVFSMAWQLGALAPLNALRDDNAEAASDLMLVAALARQLQLGLDAIVDATALLVRDRDRLRAVAEALDATFVGIECRCGEEQVQRSRVEGRLRGIPGWPATVSWPHVQRMRERWEPWDGPHLVVDTAYQDPDTTLRAALDAIRAANSGDPAGR